MGHYKFEGQHESFGTPEEVAQDLQVFIKRLSGPDTLNSQDQILLKRFVKTNHRAADWYGRARDKRRRSQKNYARGRIILLLFIPISILGLSLQWKDQAAVTQATILVTGIMAAFRASSEWMENTFKASNFAKAASELKEKIYAFEGAWNSKAFESGSLTEPCKTALQEGVVQAQEIVRKQRETYFTASAPPSVDIMGVLETARTNATKLIANYQSPKVAEAIKKEEEVKATQAAKDQHMAEIAKLTALIQGRKALIDEKEKEKMSLKDDDPRKGALTTFISTLQKAQEGTETSLLTKTTELAAM